MEAASLHEQKHAEKPNLVLEALSCLFHRPTSRKVPSRVCGVRSLDRAQRNVEDTNTKNRNIHSLFDDDDVR